MPSSAWDIRHIRLQPAPPMVAACTTYGCSLHHLRLQLPTPTVAASTAYGCRLECPRPRLDAALQREPFVPCHGLGRLQAARHVRRQEGRVTLGLNARAAELLGLGVARRKVAGRAGPHDRGRPGQAAAARRSLDKLLSHHLTLVDLAPHVLPDAILAEGVRAAREHGRLGGRRLAHADWTGDLSSRAEPVSGPAGASGSGGGGRGRGGSCRC